MISTATDLVAHRSELDGKGKQLVFTNGCFDLLHVGHVRYLQEARGLGDALVVAINSDNSVRELKGEGRPLNSASDRAEVLQGLESVDYVIVFDGKRATSLIETIRPHIYAKGGDYTLETLNEEEKEALDLADSRIEILSQVPGKSTTALLAAANEQSGQGAIKLGVLGSGSGTNLESILAAIKDGTLDAEVAIVISDVEDAGILERACNHGIESFYVDPGRRPNALALSSQKEIAQRLKAADVGLVVCAGFMKILRAPVLGSFAGRVINIHPSLLPRHKGLRAWEQALHAGDAVSGCTVHFVTDELDAGEIIRQQEVAVKEGDTPESLHARIQEAEHQLLPMIIGEFAAGIFK
jgi:formyltetrahydrofolate-dependent phosphoribosylglycinamide formyltransferase